MTATLWGAVVELAASQHGAVSTSQAAALSISRQNLRTRTANGEITWPQRTVFRFLAAPQTWEQEILIATLAGGGTVASHQTAARLHGLDGFGMSRDIHVSVQTPRHPRLAGVHVHRAASLTNADVVALGAIQMTSLARTLSDLGQSVSDDRVEQALDDALRRGISPKWIQQTHERLHRPGPSGTHSLGRVLALPDRSGNVNESWRERVTARLLAHQELQPLEVQHVIRVDGKALARPDLAIVDCRLGIEYHSDQWHFGPRRGRSDRRRDLAVAGAGWQLLYLDATDHRSPDDALAAVLAVVRHRRNQSTAV